MPRRPGSGSTSRGAPSSRDSSRSNAAPTGRCSPRVASRPRRCVSRRIGNGTGKTSCHGPWNVVLVAGEPAFEASAVGGPFWDEGGARSLVALAGLGDTATVERIERRDHREPPPAPFNTTSFLAQASRMGHSPSRAMAAAQELYVRGEISYPRTDNTVYPPSLPVREILDRLRKSPYHDYVERLLERPELDPSRGPIHTTDHPPIHPTAAPAKRREGLRATVYDMIARRFLATLSPPSLSTITEVHLRLGDTEFL